MMLMVTVGGYLVFCVICRSAILGGRGSRNVSQDSELCERITNRNEKKTKGMSSFMHHTDQGSPESHPRSPSSWLVSIQETHRLVSRLVAQFQEAGGGSVVEDRWHEQ
jgi:hypothetical protein